MAPLTDPERTRHYHTCLSLWNYNCYIHLKKTAFERLLAELEGITIAGLGRLLWEHVQAGGTVDEVRETREEYRGTYDFHYDFRLALSDGRRLYVETVLEMGREPDDSMIIVVSIHDA